MYRDITCLIKDFGKKYREYPNLIIMPEERYSEGNDILRYQEYKDDCIFKDTGNMEKPDIIKISLRIIPCKHINEPMVLKGV